MNINKSCREQVDKCMNITFGPITQPFIRDTLEKHKTIVLALLLFYYTRKNPKKPFKVLSFVIYTMINDYFLY